MNQDSLRTSRNVTRSLVLASLALCAMFPAVASAQEHEHGAGNGFLFGKPDGTFTLRGGYSRANATGDIYDFQKKEFTFGPRGFDALSLGVDLGVSAGRRFDVGVSFDGTVRSHGSEYRAWLDNNDQPIKQTTNLSTFGISANVKYNLRDRGRSISRFAWIPSQYVPYIGVGAGMLGYTFRQKGDFIDLQTTDVYTDELTSTAWGGMGQIFSGVSYSIGPRCALISEARYTLSTAKMTQDYTDFDRINLSGLSLNFGTAIRF